MNMDSTADVNSDVHKTFDAIAAYFVNCYWNQLYKHAETILAERKDVSIAGIDEAYKLTLRRYYAAFSSKTGPDDRENSDYTNIIADLHNVYKYYFKSAISLDGFVGIVVAAVVPADIYQQMEGLSHQKNAFFRQTLTECLMKFTMYIVSECVHDVINARQRDAAMACLAKWKKAFIGFMYQERIKLQRMAVAQAIGAPLTAVAPSSDTGDMMPAKVVVAMQEKIKLLLSEKADLIRLVNAHVVSIKRYQLTIKKLIGENKKLEVLNTQMTAMIENSAEISEEDPPPRVAPPAAPAAPIVPAAPAVAVPISTPLDNLEDFGGDRLDKITNGNLAPDVGVDDISLDDTIEYKGLDADD